MSDNSNETAAEQGNQSSVGTEQPLDCDWCGNKIQRLGGNVEKNLCGTCLGKAKCGWTPDKDRSLDAGTERSEGGEA